MTRIRDFALLSIASAFVIVMILGCAPPQPTPEGPDDNGTDAEDVSWPETHAASGQIDLPPATVSSFAGGTVTSLTGVTALSADGTFSGLDLMLPPSGTSSSQASRSSDNGYGQVIVFESGEDALIGYFSAREVEGATGQGGTHEALILTPRHIALAMLYVSPLTQAYPPHVREVILANAQSEAANELASVEEAIRNVLDSGASLLDDEVADHIYALVAQISIDVVGALTEDEYGAGWGGYAKRTPVVKEWRTNDPDLPLDATISGDSVRIHNDTLQFYGITRTRSGSDGVVSRYIALPREQAFDIWHWEWTSPAETIEQLHGQTGRFRLDCAKQPYWGHEGDELAAVEALKLNVSRFLISGISIFYPVDLILSVERLKRWGDAELLAAGTFYDSATGQLHGHEVERLQQLSDILFGDAAGIDPDVGDVAQIFTRVADWVNSPGNWSFVKENILHQYPNSQNPFAHALTAAHGFWGRIGEALGDALQAIGVVEHVANELVPIYYHWFVAETGVVLYVERDAGNGSVTGDRDGDGVPDDRDECPSTAPGAVVDAAGCPVSQPGPTDSDGDGVPDNEDGCPYDSNKTDPGECGCGEPETCDGPGPGPTPTGETLTLNLGGGETMELVRIPAGSFMMGTDSTDYSWLEHSRPVHSVTISRDFYIGRYEVTQAQWQAVMGNNPSYFDGCEDCPVEEVSWDDAVDFCDAVSSMTGYDIRLPSEAEREYACRAGTTTEYSFGDDESALGDYAWYYGNSGSQTHEVGGKLPNPWGLYDMHGNVLEWCQDVWHEDYSSAPSDGSAWTSGGDSSRRVLRGGSWGYFGYLLRSAGRSWAGPGLRDDYYGGFRIAAGT